MPQAASPLAYAAGFVIGTGLLHLAGISLGLLARSQPGALAVRGMGAADRARRPRLSDRHAVRRLALAARRSRSCPARPRPTTPSATSARSTRACCTRSPTRPRACCSPPPRVLLARQPLATVRPAYAALAARRRARRASSHAVAAPAAARASRHRPRRGRARPRSRSPASTSAAGRAVALAAAAAVAAGLAIDLPPGFRPAASPPSAARSASRSLAPAGLGRRRPRCSAASAASPAPSPAPGSPPSASWPPPLSTAFGTRSVTIGPSRSACTLARQNAATRPTNQTAAIAAHQVARHPEPAPAGPGTLPAITADRAARAAPPPPAPAR